MSSSNRRPYLTSNVLDQALLDFCHDNLECKIEMVCEIESPTGTIYASDRNKYVDGTFYEALLVFPTIGRTVGEWLSNDLQFSTLTLELSNVDGRFNNILQSGNNYGGWVNKQVVVKVGLAEKAGTYTTIFKGTITPVGGFQRSINSIIIVARDNYDRINAKFPNTAITYDSFPKCEQKNLGKIIPLIYGDWTVELEPFYAAIPAYCTNGSDPFVAYKEKEVTISGSTLSCVAHALDEGGKIELVTTGSLPSPLAISTAYYVRNPLLDSFEISLSPGGAVITSSGAQTGTHQFKPFTGEPRKNLSFLISENANYFFDTSKVYVRRSEVYSLVPSAEVTNVNGNKNIFEVKQGALWMNDGAGVLIAYAFDSGDEFFVQVRGKNIGYDNNIVWQAHDIIITYGGLIYGDFDLNWETYRDKATPAQSSISTFKSRIWLNESTPAMTYVLSLLEQVRLEAFIDRDLKLKLNSLHFEDWDELTTYNVKNWDVVEGSLRARIDEKNNFNRAQAAFNFLPIVNENSRATSIMRNDDAITQMAGLKISKKIVFPNLYQSNVVASQLIEIVRLASGTIEIFDINLTWRAMLLDIGNFVKLNVSIGSVILNDVPGMIRDIGYDPDGLKIVIKIWSFQMFPFKTWNPGYFGIVSGQNGTITQEI
ncbi:MAG: hypothetical protein RLZZ74_3432 [Cyanobacteriota bacterium]